MQLTKKSYENILSQNNGIFFFLEGHDILPGSWYIDIFLRNLLQGHSRKMRHVVKTWHCERILHNSLKCLKVWILCATANPPKSDDKYAQKSVQLVRVSSFRSDFLQNQYFSDTAFIFSYIGNWYLSNWPNICYKYGN